jgi:hypothetical protein
MLKKKTFTILLLVIGFAIMGLCISSDAKAENHCVNFNITLDSVARFGGDIFEYRYFVTSGAIDVSKISLFHLGIDANLVEACPLPESECKVTVTPPGPGLNTDGWLEGVPQLQILSSPAQSNTEGDPMIIYVSGTGGNVGKIAAHTKQGRIVETCFVDGPVAGLPADASVPSSKVVNLNGVDYCIDLDPRTGCPVPNPTVYVCSLGPDTPSVDPPNPLPIDDDFVLGGNADGTDPNGDPTGPTTPTIVMGEGSDPRCPVSKAAHNPCQWIIIGGTPYGEYCWPDPN